MHVTLYTKTPEILDGDDPLVEYAFNCTPELGQLFLFSDVNQRLILSY